MKNLLLFVFFSATIVSCNKYEKSIDRVNSMAGTNELRLEEGWKDGKIPIVDDSIINYIIESKGFDDITYLKIENCPKITFEGYKKLMTLKNIENLYLYDLPISNQTLNVLISKYESLKWVHLRDLENVDSIQIGSYKSMRRFDIERCNQLKHVYLKNAQNELFVSIENSIKGNTFKVELENCSEPHLYFKDNTISDSFVIAGDSVQYSLSFYHCEFENIKSDFFCSFKTVTELSIESNTTNEFHISNLPFLKDLEINSVYENEDDKKKQLSNLYLNNLPELHYLHISSDSLKEVTLENADSLWVVDFKTQIPEFEFSAISNLITFVFSGKILQDKKILDVLSVPTLYRFYYHPDTITDRQLNFITKNPNIKSLELSELRNEGDLEKVLMMKNIIELELFHPNIKELKLNAVDSLVFFNISDCQTLRTVDIQNCMNLTDFHIEDSHPKKLNFSNLPKLKSLSVGLCNLTDFEKFEKDLNTLNVMKLLSFRLCQTEHSLDLRKLKNLKYLTITDNKLKELILNKEIEESVSLGFYKGVVKYVEY